MGFRFFSLRVKLVLVSVLLLTIPLIGFWYASQMQAYLMSAQEQALTLTAKAVSTILYERPDLFESNILQSFDEQKEIHTYLINNKITLDGYSEDWQDLLGQAKYYGFDNVLENYGIYEDDTLNFKHLIGKRNNYYYVLFIVKDDSIVFRDPTYVGLNKSDHLRITVQGKYEGQHDRYFLSPSGSSEVNGHLMRRDPLNFVPERYEPDIWGYWRETIDGYIIEIRLPVAMAKNGRISFAIGDVDDQETRKLNTVVGTSGTRQSSDLGFLLARSPMLESIISALHSPSARIRVIDSRLRQRASVGQYYGEPDKFQIEEQNNFSWKNLLKPIYAFFSDKFKEEQSQAPKYLSQIEDQGLKRAIRDGQAFTLRRSVAESDADILVAGEPIKYGNKVMGTVLVEQATNNILTEKNKIIEKTINITLIVFLLGGIVLIAFASRLSNRIRQLATQTADAIGPDGRIKDSFKASKIQDELGDLSRWFAAMLKRLKDYNNYQEKMADNLEHEIRTPIAGISASLANLEKKIATSDTEVQNHLSGIRENAKRIESMMTNIREATLLEDALKLDEQTGFDLKEALIVWVRDGYKQTFAENSFVLKFPEQPVPFYGDPIRIRQMLDKLIENAVDFSDSDNPITIKLSKENQQAQISIINEGPELPLELQEHIFDSMVSIRKKSDKESHLGLGLYVTRQIAEFHGGSILAKNRVDGAKGVIFTVFLPFHK
ncbi:MAG: ATP-binding protein [Thermodesulfobacteriota bacterium]|jgi:dedicated sortase system histidine kinase